MTKKMLIDAAHPEEVRVAVLDNGKVEDFDFESEARKPLRGNIYLARVTRVEPSLQAAFVEYGGNRHGFLAFSEIHPDYYQIPVSDRRLLQAAEAEVAELAAELELHQRGDEDEDDHDDGDHHHHDEESDREPAKSRGRNRGNDDENNTVEVQADDDVDADEESKRIASGDDLTEDENDDPVDEIAEPSSEEEEEEEDGEEDSDGAEAETVRTSRRRKKSKEPEVDPVQAVQEDDSSNTSDEPVDEAEAMDVEPDGGDEQSAEESDEQPDVEAKDSVDDQSGDEGEQPKKPEKSAAAKRQALFERYKDAKRKRSNLLRNYKIQEVIKRRQILLIQVVKEERGNKGAALTTYMSLAGRYCVLMPNTARGGGISRKIPHSTDRKRLRRVVDSLDVPQGMGLIIRTAGAKRTKVEVKRDYDYLLRLWENIRTLTLKSIAPCLIYEEASLIKRAIRDLYDKDISEVQVEGENGYREAKDFMKMLMPSHAKFVQPYKSDAPIFLKYGVESQLDGMYQPTVRLKSGGYIVIHQTEALVAIDVNSGRATRERNIEQTALKTNIEAAYEAARQFRLRDLAGLIVLDFIDMEEPKNNRKVEKALKDAIKHDRARIQLGRISNFGLLEMSRQRRRSGIVDGTTQTCPTCAGAGAIRSAEMAALRILRAIEGEAVAGKAGLLDVHGSLDVTVYILNHHRDWLKRIEDEQGVTIQIIPDREKAGDEFTLEKSGAPRERANVPTVIQADQSDFIEAVEPPEAEAEEDSEDNGGDRKKRRRRRRRKDGSSRDAKSDSDNAQSDIESDAVEAGESDEKKAGEQEDEEGARKRRRRGRRGGRRNRRTRGDSADASKSADDSAEQDSASSDETTAESENAGARDDVIATDTSPDNEDAAPAHANGSADQPHAEPVSNGEAGAPSPESAPEPAVAAEVVEETPQPASPQKPKKRGWWSRGSDA